MRQENVLRLHITVRDALHVHMVQSTGQLEGDVDGCASRKRVSGRTDRVAQVAAPHQFHDQELASEVMEAGVQVGDVGVSTCGLVKLHFSS